LKKNNDLISDALLQVAINRHTINEFDKLGKMQYSLPDPIFSEKFLKERGRIVSKSKSKDFRKRLVKNIPKVAAIIFIVVIASTALGVLTVDAFRQRIFDVFRAITGNSFIFVGDEGSNPFNEFTDKSRILLNLLPDGFSLESENIEEGKGHYKYSSFNGNYLSFFIYSIEASIYSVYAPEEEESYNVTITNNKSKIFHKRNDDLNFLVWFDESYYYTIKSNIGIEQLLEILEELE